MTMTVTLTHGTLDITDNLDRWIITSDKAVAYGASDVLLHRGDIITIAGDVIRDGAIIANIRR